MEQVAAIIVTHNSEDHIGECLDALRGRAKAIVVDNASSDATVCEASKRPWAEVIVNQSNRGFAAAVNQGVRAANSDLLLILNPDAILTTGLEPLVQDCRTYGIAAGCLTDATDSPQRGFCVRSLPSPLTLIFECLGLNRCWPFNPVNRKYRCLSFNLERPGFVEQPAGAMLMLRRDVFDKLSGLDEDFWPVWFEDVDFAKRACLAGYLTAYNPASRAKHAGAHSVSAISSSAQKLYWYGSLLRYAGKYYRAQAFRTICLAVIVGSVVRISTGIFDRRRGNPFRDYQDVIRLAALSLVDGNVVYPDIVSLRESGQKALESSPVDSG